ncbi:Clathrin assembly protein [Actinidia chinensis var. chinensis]|uniref:Clathrin assembly protein n=1 Tax=Actinidia chinensis var. chinensis TaxID=1590841 RepID=A0A2R6R4X7_ACTCC|nr:Clathrin assembly protein [Actinidia chinensis var. chinensis]
MTEAGNAQQSFRKALGALKDSTTVGLVRVNSDYKDLDVAVVKATNHDEVLPKEKHVRTIFVAVSASRPRADVVYCINALSKRLAKTHNWAVALKTLIVVHRAMRELDLTFRVELVNYSHRRGLVLNLSHFRDDSCPNAWDYSAWVRSYALYLEECLECFHVLKYDIQTDRSRTKDLNIPDLLEQLPALQGLLLRLLACQPKGAARFNFLIQYALGIVAAESVKLYVAITDGTLNLVDKFFEMQRHDAVRALEIYKKAGKQAERLSEFFEMCRALDFGRGHKYVKIEQPPASFLAAMEEYVQDAPQTVMLLPWHPDNNDRVDTPKAISAPETDLETESKLEPKVEEKPDPSSTSTDGVVATTQVVDLLCLDEPIQETSELDEKNALALAIVTLDDPLNPTNSSILASESTNWELELVTAPSSNGATVAGSKLAGGLDKLTLDSLYDNALARAKQNENYQMGMMESPLEVVPYNQYPFYASSNVAPPMNVQMEAMSQQHALIMLQQQQQMVGNVPTNPFGNPEPTNPFGNPGNPFVEQNASSYPP